MIFSDQFKVLVHYLSGPEIRRLRDDTTELAQSLRELHQSGRGALWVVSPAPAHAFRTSARIGDLRGWLYDNCQLRNTVGVARVDFRQYYLQIYRCPATTSGVSAATAE